MTSRKGGKRLVQAYMNYPPLGHEPKRALYSASSSQIPMKEDLALSMLVTTLADGKSPCERLLQNDTVEKKYAPLGIGNPSSCADVAPSSRFGAKPHQVGKRIDFVESREDDLSDLDNILDAFDPSGPSPAPAAFPTFHQLQRTVSLPPPPSSSSSNAGSRDLSSISRQNGSLSDMIAISRLLKRVKEAESARHIAEATRDELILSQKELSRALRMREQEVSNAALVKEALAKEISSLSRQLNGLCADKQALSDENARVVMRLHRLAEMRDSLVMEKDDMELRLEGECGLLQSAMDDMNREMEHLVQSNIELSFQLSASLSVNDDLDVQLDASVAVEAGHLDTILQLTEERDKLRKDVGFGEQAKLEMVVKMEDMEHTMVNLQKENRLLKMRLVESCAEDKVSTKRIVDITGQLRAKEIEVGELKAALDAAAVREASLNARNTELETGFREVSESLTMEQERTHRATQNVACLQSELGEAHKRSSYLRAEIADMKDEADVLRRDLKLTESRCKILGMEMDRPLWETAKQQRERVEQEEKEEALREATKKYMEQMMKTERARAAEEARIQRENEQTQREETEKQRKAEEARVQAEAERRRAEAIRAEEARKRAETERRQREELEKQRQAEERRKSEAAEKQRQTEEAIRRRRAAEVERLRRVEAERAFWERTQREQRAREEEISRQNRWRQATHSEQSRCSARDFAIWPGPPTHWSRSTALSRFHTVLGEFTTIQFSEKQPLTLMSVPWPSLDKPSTVETDITQGRYGWNDVDMFFQYAKSHMALGEYQKMVKSCRLCFHPDKWAGRSLLVSVQDEGTREMLKEVGTSVSQSVNAITI
ncbi:hypothetical protein BDZ89DRAFT_79425 [Hymenopellis radicata]|nr:hypothetical protein BDZ89DRAFT_79425 [Hymenopellis radicata]